MTSNHKLIIIVFFRKIKKIVFFRGNTDSYFEGQIAKTLETIFPQPKISCFYMIVLLVTVTYDDDDLRPQRILKKHH